MYRTHCFKTTGMQFWTSLVISVTTTKIAGCSIAPTTGNSFEVSVSFFPLLNHLMIQYTLRILSHNKLLCLGKHLLVPNSHKSWILKRKENELALFQYKLRKPFSSSTPPLPNSFYMTQHSQSKLETTDRDTSEERSASYHGSGATPKGSYPIPLQTRSGSPKGAEETQNNEEDDSMHSLHCSEPHLNMVQIPCTNCNAVPHVSMLHCSLYMQSFAFASLDTYCMWQHNL